MTADELRRLMAAGTRIGDDRARRACLVDIMQTAAIGLDADEAYRCLEYVAACLDNRERATRGAGQP